MWISLANNHVMMLSSIQQASISPPAGLQTRDKRASRLFGFVSMENFGAKRSKAVMRMRKLDEWIESPCVRSVACQSIHDPIHPWPAPAMLWVHLPQRSCTVPDILVCFEANSSSVERAWQKWACRHSHRGAHRRNSNRLFKRQVQNTPKSGGDGPCRGQGPVQGPTCSIIF